MWFIEEWYLSLPRVTRAYLTAIVATTLALYLELVSLLLLYLNFGLVYDRFEIWRLVTNFLFFGHFGLGFFFHLTFLCALSNRGPNWNQISLCLAFVTARFSRNPITAGARATLCGCTSSVQAACCSSTGCAGSPGSP